MLEMLADNGGNVIKGRRTETTKETDMRRKRPEIT